MSKGLLRSTELSYYIIPTSVAENALPVVRICVKENIKVDGEMTFSFHLLLHKCFH